MQLRTPSQSKLFPPTIIVLLSAMLARILCEVTIILIQQHRISISISGLEKNFKVISRVQQKNVCIEKWSSQPIISSYNLICHAYDGISWSMKEQKVLLLCIIALSRTQAIKLKPNGLQFLKLCRCILLRLIARISLLV